MKRADWLSRVFSHQYFSNNQNNYEVRSSEKKRIKYEYEIKKFLFIFEKGRMEMKKDLLLIMSSRPLVFILVRIVLTCNEE